MRATELYKTRKNVISMEFFPPRNQEAEAGFGSMIDELATVKPDYMTVTFGAGGSTRDGSYQTVKQIWTDKKIPAVAYLAGYGLGPDELTAVLDKYRDLGIQTIFVIRGDKPQGKEFNAHPQSFSYASEMIAFIKKRYDFTLGCAGYPEGHIEAKNREEDIAHLKEKVDQGAEYIVTQYFYDNAFYFDYVERCRKAGIRVPIVPGVMPVYTVKMTQMLAKVCGAKITDALKKRLDAVGDADKDGVLNVGIDFATEQCAGLLEHGVPGLHFYTMNRRKSTADIIHRLKADHLL
jgi:methylenetetrahydrofolate reductase (NADPH)